MADRIKFSTRGSVIADAIEKELRSGAWTNRLPGLRFLSERYGVSINTCVSALDILEQRGWLAPAKLGQRRAICRQVPEAEAVSKETDKRLLIIHPSVGTWAASGNVLLHRAGYTWSRYHGEVAWEGVDFRRIKSPGRALDGLIARHTPAAILMAMPGPRWTKEAARRLPFYQMGGPRDANVPVSYNAFDLNAEVAKVAAYLRRLGHRRILVPQQWGVSTMQASLVKSLKVTAGQKPEFGRWEDYCPDFSENVPEVWRDYWDHSFKALRPTAVVLFEDTHLFSFYGFCYLRGIRIPEDVSVICLDDQKLFNWCAPRPTTMRYPERAATAHFEKWITGGLSPIGVKFLSLKMIEGETVAPPPKEN